MEMQWMSKILHTRANYMSKSKNQIDSFTRGLDRLVENYASEYDMTYAEMVGVLSIKVDNMIHDLRELEKEDEK